MNPYECRPTPSMLTPNQERLPLTLPKTATPATPGWGGFAGERGVAVLAVFGNVIGSLSWFGVNMLGVGLHSYGFMDQAFGPLLAFVASQLVIMGIGLLPLKYWRGIRARGRRVVETGGVPAH